VTLLAVPNVSEGRDLATVAALGVAFASHGVRLLDTHSDADHHRTVFTLAGPPSLLSEALLEGARATVEAIDVMSRADRSSGDRAQTGQHPHVGAIDVVPLVYLDSSARGAACATALVLADRIGEEFGVPVFLYGALADGRPRAELRKGGPERLAERMRLGELQPDFGPRRPHPRAGATLVAARAPLVAFNLQLAAPASLDDARRIAGLVREGGAEGLPGLRAIGVQLRGPLTSPRAGASADSQSPDGEMGVGSLERGPVAQVSMNVERPFEVPLAQVLAAVRRHAEVASAELVGLAPRAALAGFPEEVRLVGFDPARHVIEHALGVDTPVGGTHSV
jgi:glutamate formiminotransferase